MKSSVTEKRTQVCFPEKLYRDVKKRAKAESKSVAAVVREAVEKHLEAKEIDWENDPFIKAVGFIKSDVTDAGHAYASKGGEFILGSSIIRRSGSIRRGN